jgi:ATP-dependent Clp protease ATP-binding subunit ClpA
MTEVCAQNSVTSLEIEKFFRHMWHMARQKSLKYTSEDLFLLAVFESDKYKRTLCTLGADFETLQQVSLQAVSKEEKCQPGQDPTPNTKLHQAILGAIESSSVAKLTTLDLLVKIFETRDPGLSLKLSLMILEKSD